MLLQIVGPVIAQAGKFGGPNQGQQAPDAAGLMGMCFCYGFALLVGLIVQIFFLLSLSRCLAECAPRNRTMEPGQVWLNLIPFFNLVWLILTILRLSESLQNEFRSRRLRSDDPDFGKMTGILFYVFNFVCGLVSLVFFIMYWAKIAGYTRQLREDRGGGGRDRDDYDDDRPQRPRRDRDNEDDDRY